MKQIRLKFYNPVVTVFTTGFKIKNPTFCPHSVSVFYGSQNKQRLFPCTALTDWVFFSNRDEVCLLRVTDWVFT